MDNGRPNVLALEDGRCPYCGAGSAGPGGGCPHYVSRERKPGGGGYVYRFVRYPEDVAALRRMTKGWKL